MKKLIFSIAALCAFGVASAQDEGVKFGVKAGVQSTNVAGDAEGDAAMGFFVGGLVDLPISGNFHLQPEVLYSMEGAEDFSLSYIRIPIMAKYYVMQGLNLQAGPQVALKIGAENDFVDESVKSIDFGIGAGAAYETTFGLFFDLRYNLGLSNISEAENADVKNVGIQVGVGYRF